MKEIIMRNTVGEQTNISVVRYFRLNSIDYLIFSLNEVDEGGYVKLYVTKVIEGTGKTIEDDVEWNLIKDTIKTVIKSNKDNLPLNITDLDVSRINNLQIMDQKVFKLNDSLLQLLAANVIADNETTSDYQMASQETLSSVLAPETVVESSVIAGIANDSQEIPSDTDFSENSNQLFNVNISAGNVEANGVKESFNNQPNEYQLDYKTLYENELNKNEELTHEIEKYKNVIDSLKHILNENI